jgi:hypothetical protein
MKRRDLFSTLAGGYSLAVLADRLPAAPQAATGITGRIRRDMDRIAPASAGATLAAEPHMKLVELESDILVAGGGVAGVCAAVAAARNGARVILLQDRSRLGGNSSSEVKMHIVGANSHKSRPGWREGGLIEEFRLDDAANNPQRCWEMWDLLLYDKVVSEPNLTLLLETTLYHADMSGGRIRSVLARCDRSETLYRIKANLFVDATGDSRLGLEAGADMRSGREARSEFNESLAPEKADEQTLGSSILFTSRLHHKAMPFTPPKWARKVTRESLRFRDIGPQNWEYGYWWIEWGGDRDIIHDNERIRFELLSIVMGVWDFIKNSGEHTGSANWALEWVGMMPGKRGSRRLLGDHVLTQNDLLQGSFPDAVAIGGWPMDDHPPGGFDRSDLPPNTVMRTPEVYDIPLRSLYSRNVPNLMMAGRNISATHAAFTSTRVMATCAAVGQATGTAAAICVERGIIPRQLANDRSLVTRLQQQLLRDDQTLKNIRNEDANDLARQARLSASSGDASLAVDGYLRDIPSRDGTPKDIHRWTAPVDERPWVELAWEGPRRLRQLQLTFDSGFQRELTLSASDSISRTIVRAPQPETVRDYEIRYRAGGVWRTLRQVAGNHQRVNRHSFDAIEAEAVRIVITSTNGLADARIFEIRAYA